jgi:MOSC domain-containing protein YiiM
MARLVALAVRPVRRCPVCLLDELVLSVHDGIAGDRYSKPGRRQVTVLTCEGWATACADLGVELHWSARWANLLIEGLDLRDSLARVLCVGNARLEITGQNNPCRRMDEVQAGLLKALGPGWRAGVTARVLVGARIRVGVPVEWGA